MDSKPRCQSCGMPLSKQFGNLGTNADGSDNPVFCSICFKDGNFLIPQLTLEEMIQSSIKNMTEELKMPQDKAEQHAHDIIPTLARWKITK